jgi:cardiolipin synthase (CMP-forming)
VSAFGSSDAPSHSASERGSNADRDPGSGGQQNDAKWTIPNALSVLRLLGVPLFVWLLLGPHADLAALIVLATAGFTDWLDGVLARALHQTSRLGALLDPAADRLYIVATLVALVLRHIVPWELAAVLLLRDLLLLLTVPGLRRLGLTALPVHYLGKAATFALLYAFPLLLLGEYHTGVAAVAKPIAWAFTLWGTGLYLWAGVLYLRQYRALMRTSTA